jgi:Acyl-CoA dehydrogenase, C-terminal domain
VDQRHEPDAQAGTSKQHERRRNSSTEARHERLECTYPLEDCEVAADNLLGKVCDGVRVLMSGLDYERAVVSGGPLGIMAACMEVVIPYVHDRKQFGQPIGDSGILRISRTSMASVSLVPAAMVSAGPGSLKLNVIERVANVCRTRIMRRGLISWASYRGARPRLWTRRWSAAPDRLQRQQRAQLDAVLRRIIPSFRVTVGRKRKCGHGSRK